MTSQLADRGQTNTAIAERRNPSRWTADHVAAIDTAAASQTRLISPEQIERVSEEVDFWDAWPLQDKDGTPSAVRDAETLWFALAAPRHPDPDERHGLARIHLVSRGPAGWHDLGPAMPDGFSPGSREWSGSAVLDDDRRTVTLYFTATGRRGDHDISFEQRLFEAKATLATTAEGRELAHWRDLKEIALRDPAHYMASDAGTGRVGTIKAYRDPAYFRDPADGSEHLFFAASDANSSNAFNGVIGAAVLADDWETMPPIVTADGLNNELERPHVVHHGGLYYLFWSTQTHVFADDGPSGPTGLYGMVADTLIGPWKPLNGTGLVFSNPVEAPRQAYSWFVMPDLMVTSFVDDWGVGRREGRERRFGATFAPMLWLNLDGDRASLRV